jgi:hypothetical protein
VPWNIFEDSKVLLQIDFSSIVCPYTVVYADINTAIVLLLQDSEFTAVPRSQGSLLSRANTLVLELAWVGVICCIICI